LFTDLIGSIALTVGLAFGLGGRDVTAQITQKYYEGGRSTADAERQRAGTSTGGGAKVYRANPPSETEPPR